MRVKELIPFIDDHQEVVILSSEGGKTLGGTAAYHRKKVKLWT